MNNAEDPLTDLISQHIEGVCVESFMARMAACLIPYLYISTLAGFYPNCDRR